MPGSGSLVRGLLGNILVASLMVAAFYFFYQQLMEPPDGVDVIERMTFFPGASISPVRQQLSDGEQRPLPDDWLKTAPGETEGWYLADVEPAANLSDGWGIYLPVIHMNADVFLNGRLIGRIRQYADEYSHGDPYAREINRPVYFPAPDDLTAGERYTLRIHVTSSRPGSGLLGPVYTGADMLLKAAYKKRFAARVTTVQVISAGMLTMAIFMTVLWFLRREDSVYGWYALLVYTWAAHNIFFLGVDTPFPAPVEDALSTATLGWFVVFMVITTHRYLGVQLIRFERIILISATLGSLALVISNGFDWSPVAVHRVWSTLVIGLGIYTLAMVVPAYHYRDDLKNPFMLPAGFSVLLLGAHDLLVVMGQWPRDGGLLLHFSAPVTLIVFGSLLLERFSGVLRTAESLNLALEQRVAEKHQELEANFEKLRKMENRQTLADERERFTKEMHDGVGGHLVSMLSMMRGGEKSPDKIMRAIEATLSDLRIMIDSLDPREHDIPTLLGAMRMRLEPQLANNQLRFEWQVGEIPPIPDFGPRNALQVMRILQEAITNIISHAEATLIRVKARVDVDAQGIRVAVLDVIDDGKGFLPDIRRGHGLNNMEQRATSIGAILEIASADPGTRVRLIFSYAPHQ
ncbi:MAG: hypothetical protein L3J98_06820 [Gammaproteobacteria bacterium]|nr:hypothetical protein [Gammaproteobacteria bacterium]MCF6259859.1 hypothetical protein [Gammaproteobacteria bacterium]